MNRPPTYRSEVGTLTLKPDEAFDLDVKEEFVRDMFLQHITVDPVYYHNLFRVQNSGTYEIDHGNLVVNTISLPVRFAHDETSVLQREVQVYDHFMKATALVKSTGLECDTHFFTQSYIEDRLATQKTFYLKSDEFRLGFAYLFNRTTHTVDLHAFNVGVGESTSFASDVFSLAGNALFGTRNPDLNYVAIRLKEIARKPVTENAFKSRIENEISQSKSTDVTIEGNRNHVVVVDDFHVNPNDDIVYDINDALTVQKNTDDVFCVKWPITYLRTARAVRYLDEYLVYRIDTVDVSANTIRFRCDANDLIPFMENGSHAVLRSIVDLPLVINVGTPKQTMHECNTRLKQLVSHRLVTMSSLNEGRPAHVRCFKVMVDKINPYAHFVTYLPMPKTSDWVLCHSFRKTNDNFVPWKPFTTKPYDTKWLDENNHTRQEPTPSGIVKVDSFIDFDFYEKRWWAFRPPATELSTVKNLPVAAAAVVEGPKTIVDVCKTSTTLLVRDVPKHVPTAVVSTGITFDAKRRTMEVHGVVIPISVAASWLHPLSDAMETYAAKLLEVPHRTAYFLELDPTSLDCVSRQRCFYFSVGHADRIRIFVVTALISASYDSMELCVGQCADEMAGNGNGTWSSMVPLSTFFTGEDVKQNILRYEWQSVDLVQKLTAARNRRRVLRPLAEQLQEHLKNKNKNKDLLATDVQLVHIRDLTVVPSQHTVRMMLYRANINDSFRVEIPQRERYTPQNHFEFPTTSVHGLGDLKDGKLLVETNSDVVSLPLVVQKNSIQDACAGANFIMLNKTKKLEVKPWWLSFDGKIVHQWGLAVRRRYVLAYLPVVKGTEFKLCVGKASLNSGEAPVMIPIEDQDEKTFDAIRRERNRNSRSPTSWQYRMFWSRSETPMDTTKQWSYQPLVKLTEGFDDYANFYYESPR